MAGDHISRSWWRLRFEVEFRRRTAQGFEDLVQAILEHRFPDEYKQVKPAGSIGDEKCDGLLTDQRTLVACYGPEGWDKDKALAKIDADFTGAVEHWDEDFETWAFAHNDVRGAPPYVQHALAGITADEAHDKAAVQWGFAKLRDLAFRLQDDQLTELLGPAITLSDVLSVEIRDIVPLLRTLETAPAELSLEIQPVPADKLERNAFSEFAIDLLKVGRRRSKSVGDYFEGLVTRPLFRDELGGRFSAKYLALRDDGLSPDEILGALTEWAGGPSMTPQTQGAVLTVIAYFLEQCDIYEVDVEEASA